MGESGLLLAYSQRPLDWSILSFRSGLTRRPDRGETSSQYARAVTELTDLVLDIILDNEVALLSTEKQKPSQLIAEGSRVRRLDSTGSTSAVTRLPAAQFDRVRINSYKLFQS